MGKKLIFTALLLSLSVAALSQERVTEARSDLEKNLFTLASDEMLGRGAGTEQVLFKMITSTQGAGVKKRKNKRQLLWITLS